MNRLKSFLLILFFVFAEPTILFAQSSISFSESILYGDVLPTLDDGEFQCDPEYSWIKQDPFKVSAQFGNTSTFKKSGNSYERNWDNFRAIHNSLGVESFLPQRSIVRLINPAHRTIPADETPGRDDFVPVEVVSIPENKTRQYSKVMKKEVRDMLQSDSPIAKQGDIGRVHKNVLTPAGRYTFVLRNDSFLRKIPGLDDTVIGQAKAVTLSTRESGDNLEYEARKCCLAGDENKCVYKYRWKILDRNLKELKDKSFDLDPNNEECTILDEIRPVDKDQAQALIRTLEAAQSINPESTLDDIEYIDSMGLIKFPWQYYEDNGVTAIEGPSNSSHYNNDDGRQLSDSYVNATTGCALLQVLKKWNELNPAEVNEVQIGNMWHPKTWGPHKTHEKKRGHGGAHGTCVDIRPMTTIDAPLGLNLVRETCEEVKRQPYNTNIYDKNKTSQFISLLKSAGADTVLFSGPGTGGQELKCHGDHIHVCFNPNNSTVKNTCTNGL